MNEMKEILLAGEPERVEPALPRAAMMLFAPIDKRAFGVAIGTVSALAILVATAVALMLHPQPSINLALLAQYFPGYAVSLPGALVGALWAFAAGFCAGWFTAFVRNLVLAVSLFLLRSKAELADSRDFLDHI
jgi:hypothetical protein